MPKQNKKKLTGAGFFDLVTPILKSLAPKLVESLGKEAVQFGADKLKQKLNGGSYKLTGGKKQKKKFLKKKSVSRNYVL